MAEIPNTPIYCTENAVKSLEGQYGKLGWNFHVVKTGDSFEVYVYAGFAIFAAFEAAILMLIRKRRRDR